MDDDDSVVEVPSDSDSASTRRLQPSNNVVQQMLRTLNNPTRPSKLISIVLDEDEPIPVPSSSRPRPTNKRSAVSRPHSRRPRTLRRAQPSRVPRPSRASAASRSARSSKTSVVSSPPDYLQSEEELDSGIAVDPKSPSDDDFRISHAVEILPARPSTKSPARHRKHTHRSHPEKSSKSSARAKQPAPNPQELVEDEVIAVSPDPRPAETLQPAHADQQRHHPVPPSTTICTDIPQWDEDILNMEKCLPLPDTGSPPLPPLAEDSGDERIAAHVPILQSVFAPVKDGRAFLLDVDTNDYYPENVKRHVQSLCNQPPYMEDADSPATPYMTECWKKYVALRDGSGAPDAAAHKPDTTQVSSYGKATQPSAQQAVDNARSSEDSDASLSSENDGERSEDEQERASRAVKARELQTRVCGELLPSMSASAKRRVMRWAEMDFSWFDPDCDVMEIEATKEMKNCARCDAMLRDKNKSGLEACEESILLKLWTDMTWRKVRRMRHRKTSCN